MLGFSVYLNQPIDDLIANNCLHMQQSGFTEVFTSMHIPEDDVTLYLKRVQALGQICRENHLDLMIDIESDSLEHIGLSLDNPQAIKAFGITGLRIDFGISNQQIAGLSQHLKIALNASTLSESDLVALKTANANFQNMEAWHNYYPRNETGLARDWFIRTNQWLKESGFTTQAFIPGDGQLRGPIKSGLPTLEEHRGQHPLACALDLLALSVDKVFIGDPQLRPATLMQFSDYFQTQTMTLHCVRETNQLPDYLFTTQFHNRRDVARDVIRLEEGRPLCKSTVVPLACAPRPIGSLTIDNLDYGRYMGELQITKTNLPGNPQVNVLGKIIDSELPLLPFILAGQAIQLKEQL